jgi:hypothetical protein
MMNKFAIRTPKRAKTTSFEEFVPVEPESPSTHESGRKIRVSEEVHTHISQLAKDRAVSMGTVVHSLLQKDSLTVIPRSPSSPSGLALVEMDCLRNLFPFFFCPTHIQHLQPELSCRGQSPLFKLTCPQGCVYSIWGTTTYSPPEDSSNNVSKSTVANQLTFALSTLNSTDGDYARFCKALALPPAATTYFTNGRSTSLRKISSLWEGQEKAAQEFAQKIDDRDLEMDGSYSQRRAAEHCFVTLLTSKHHFVVSSAVGSRKELSTTSQGLELELCTNTIVALASSPLQVRSITHDEHVGVTAMMKEKKDLLPPDFIERHDGWHRKKHISKYLPLDLETLPLKKHEIDVTVNLVLMYITSAFFTFAGNPRGFAQAIEQIPGCFAQLSEDAQRQIGEFLTKYFPADTLELYISETSTSSLEAFHGHHHQFVGKGRYLNLYRERTYLHNLIWNAFRLQDFADAHPEVQIPNALFQRDDWIRQSQALLHLVPLPAESSRDKAKVARRVSAVSKKSEAEKIHETVAFLDTESNPWE